MRGNPRTYVVTLNWNQSSHTCACVDHVHAQTVQANIIVIDNGSREGNRVVLRSKLPAGCELIELVSNTGFAVGMNVGLNHARRRKAEYVWLLNNDAFPEPDCLKRLVAALDRDPHLAAVTPALVSPDGTEQHAGATLDWLGLKLSMVYASQLPDSPGPNYWLTGTALLVRSSALRRVGPFDARFFAYWEDVDLSLRLTRAGLRFQVVPEARCVHLGNASTQGALSPFRAFLDTRNRLLLCRKHLRGVRLLASVLAVIRERLYRAALTVEDGDRASAVAMVEGLVAGCLGERCRPKLLGKLPAWFTRLVLRYPWRVMVWLDRAVAWLAHDSNAHHRFHSNHPSHESTVTCVQDASKMLKHEKWPSDHLTPH